MKLLQVRHVNGTKKQIYIICLHDAGQQERAIVTSDFSTSNAFLKATFTLSMKGGKKRMRSKTCVQY